MKKSYVKYSILALLIWIFMGSCQSLKCGPTPDALIHKMESLVQTVKTKKKTSNPEDWEVWDHKFITYYESCYDSFKSEMDAEQKGKFVGLSIRYVTMRLGNEIKSIFSDKDTEESSEFSEVLKNIADELRSENK